MPRKSRNYRAEYERRLKRAAERGLSRSQARGHPKASEPLASRPAKRVRFSRQLEHGLRQIQIGKPLQAAAREIHVSPERLRRYIRARGAEKSGRRWSLPEDKQTRRMLLYTRGEARAVKVARPQASEIGLYMSAVSEFLASNQSAHLLPFLDQGVTDTRGQFHPFETSPNALYRLASTGCQTKRRTGPFGETRNWPLFKVW